MYYLFTPKTSRMHGASKPFRNVFNRIHVAQKESSFEILMLCISLEIIIGLMPRLFRDGH